MRNSAMRIYHPDIQTGHTKKSSHPTQPSSRSSNRQNTRKPKPILYRLRRFCKRLNWKRIGLLALLLAASIFACFLMVRGALSLFSVGNSTGEAQPIEAPTPTTEAEEPAAIFITDEGTAINWQSLTDAWAAEAGFEKRYAITDEERLELAQVITAEATGEPFAGKVAVAQCILQACEDDGIRPGEVLKKYTYSTRRPAATQEALNAVQAVFDFGQVATTEPIKYFYAPSLAGGGWHETQIYVMTINSHKFFKEAKK